MDDYHARAPPGAMAPGRPSAFDASDWNILSIVRLSTWRPPIAVRRPARAGPIVAPSK
jgi:hypothetical protein